MFGRLLRGFFALSLLAVGSDPTIAQGNKPPDPPATLFDTRLNDLRIASIAWKARVIPKRQVLDVVCLVPDVPTFFDAISTWDEHVYFPILIEDAPNTLRFLRAFKPSRVVRYPKRSDPLTPAKTWEAAQTAIGRAWTSKDDSPAANAEEKELKTGRAPGVVLVDPASPMLAGGVALAAGRFQPMISMTFARRFEEVLDSAGMNEFALLVEASVSKSTKRFSELGDDCDFVTLAGNWPYRYTAKDGLRCLDDLICRSPATLERWAFTGRLLGDSSTSVYQAMCSLFLNPESAALFNSYPDRDPRFSDYSMQEAAARINALMPTEYASGDRQATLSGWHKTFDPRNRHGLVLINSKGGPTHFDLVGREASTLDVPPTLPAVVLMIHSFSAAEPTNPATIAGRWLANGVFIYHGSMNEPYLQAFRTPRLLANLIAEGIPLGAATRQGGQEPFGMPWKLIYVGDPLYRVVPRNQVEPRSVDLTKKLTDWPAYKESDRPTPESDDSAKLAWALKEMVVRTTKAGSNRPLLAVAETLNSIDRSRLDITHRPLFDDLFADVLYLGGWYSELRTKISRIPSKERPSNAQRLAVASLVVEINRLPSTAFDRAVDLWSESIRLDLGLPARAYATKHVSSMAGPPAFREAWRKRLAAALPGVQRTDTELMLRNALEQLEPARQGR